jgi:hypothetical protein
MATKTYSKNADLILPNGESLTDYFREDIEENKVEELLNTSRLAAFNEINDEYLRGKTAVPAWHISSLHDIEKLMVFVRLLNSSFVQSSSNVSDWVTEFKESYKDRLKALRFPSSASEIKKARTNSGNGYISFLETKDQFTRTEFWTLTALSKREFVPYGTRTGALPNVIVGEVYPSKDWVPGGFSDYGFDRKSKGAGDFPFVLEIKQGDTPFEYGDRFEFYTYAAHGKIETVGRIDRA